MWKEINLEEERCTNIINKYKLSRNNHRQYVRACLGGDVNVVV